MKKTELLKLCRYYKGEDKNPYEGKDQNKAMLWSYEQIWLKMAGEDTPNSLLADYCLLSASGFARIDRSYSRACIADSSPV